MVERTSGLILRTYPLTETSLIVHWLTPDLGRLATVAKGARRPKSPFRGRLDLFYQVDFSFSRSRRSELHALREASVRETHAALRRDLVRLHQAAYAARLIEQATETETPLPAVFELMSGLLRHLVQQPQSRADTVFAFEIKLLDHLGLAPALDQTTLSAGASQCLRRLLDLDWPALSSLRLDHGQANEIRQFLNGFLIYHLGRVPSQRTEALGSNT